MTEYFVLTPGDRAPRASSLHERESVWALLDAPGLPLVDPPRLTWRLSTGDRPVGWCATADRVRVLSTPLRDLLVSNAGPDDEMQWIDCELRDLDGRSIPGWSVLHFPTSPAVLDDELSTWGPSGVPMRWVLSRERVAGKKVFGIVGVQNQVLVEGDLLAEIRSAGLDRGILATPARID